MEKQTDKHKGNIFCQGCYKIGIEDGKKGMIKIEDVNKKIDEFDFADRFCLDDNMNETYNEKDKRLKDELKQSLKELGDK